MIAVRVRDLPQPQKYLIDDEDWPEFQELRYGDPVVVLASREKNKRKAKNPRPQTTDNLPSPEEDEGRKARAQSFLDAIDLEKENIFFYEILGLVASPAIPIPEEVARHLRGKVLRRPLPEDERRDALRQEIEDKAWKIATETIQKENLMMDLVDIEYYIPTSELYCYFTAEQRVAFNNLVRQLAGSLRGEFHHYFGVEMRQISERVVCGRYPGMGVCGRPLCCSSQPELCQRSVTVKDVKYQGLDISTPKYQGCCGRLMCCLLYEADAYRDLAQQFPRIGKKVITPVGPGQLKAIQFFERKGLVSLAAEPHQMIPFLPEEIRPLNASGATPESLPEKTMPKLKTNKTRPEVVSNENIYEPMPNKEEES